MGLVPITRSLYSYSIFYWHSAQHSQGWGSGCQVSRRVTVKVGSNLLQKHSHIKTQNRDRAETWAAHSQLGCRDDGLGHCTEDTGDTGGQMVIRWSIRAQRRPGWHHTGGKKGALVTPGLSCSQADACQDQDREATQTMPRTVCLPPWEREIWQSYLISE